MSSDHTSRGLITLWPSSKSQQCRAKLFICSHPRATIHPSSCQQIRQQGNALIIHPENNGSARKRRAETVQKQWWEVGGGGVQHETGETRKKESFNENKQNKRLWEIKSAVLKERVQIFGHFIHAARGVGRWPSSRPGRGNFLRPLRSFRLSLQVLSSTQDLLALYEVLVGVTERETDVLDLRTRGEEEEEEVCNPAGNQL